MPTYEYECPSCGAAFERFQSIKDPPLRKCPTCGKRVKRLIGTGVGIIFKGSGFYATDYRSDSYKKAASSDKPSAAAPKETSESKGSEKPKTESAAKAKTSG